MIGAGAVLALPRQEPRDATVEVPSPARTLSLIFRCGPLRRTLRVTAAVAFSIAALPIYAVAIAPVLSGASAAGALVAAHGAGNLLGSAGLMLWPLRGAADRLMSALALLVAATLAVVVLAPTLPTSLMAFGLDGVGRIQMRRRRPESGQRLTSDRAPERRCRLTARRCPTGR